MEQNGPNLSRAIDVHFKDKAELYAAYMPFVKGSALFVPSHKAYQLGSELTLNIKIMDEPDVYTITGTVVWITPIGAQGGQLAGIGVQFPENDTVSKTLQNKIETFLAGALQSDRGTRTM